MSRSPAGGRIFSLPTVPYRTWLGLIDAVSRIDVTLKGVGNIPRGPCIAVSNHPGREEVVLGHRIFTRPVRIMIDRVLMDEEHMIGELRKAFAHHYRFPRWFRPVGELIINWLVRQYERIGCIPVARQLSSPDSESINRRAFRRAVEALAKGEVVGLAPEGKQRPDGTVGQLQGGAAQLAWHFAKRGESMPVLPLVLCGINDLKYSLLSRARVVIAVGEPIFLEVEPGKSRREVLDGFTRNLRDTLNELYERTPVSPLPVRRG